MISWAFQVLNEMEMLLVVVIKFSQDHLVWNMQNKFSILFESDFFFLFLLQPIYVMHPALKPFILWQGLTCTITFILKSIILICYGTDIQKTQWKFLVAPQHASHIDSLKHELQIISLFDCYIDVELACIANAKSF